MRDHEAESAFHAHAGTKQVSTPIAATALFVAKTAPLVLARLRLAVRSMQQSHSNPAALLDPRITGLAAELDAPRSDFRLFDWASSGAAVRSRWPC